MSTISFNDFVSMMHKYSDMKSTSLPQFTRPALIESPNFMQASLAEEEAVNNIIKSLYNIYTGYILLTLQLNTAVVGDRKVRDLLGAVSTTSTLVSAESFLDSMDLGRGLEAALEDDKDPKDPAGGMSDAREFSRDKNVHPISAGRQIEVKFDAGKDKEPVSVLLNIKFNTRLIPDEVVNYIVNANFDLSISKRWLQMKAGEISFFRDFMFNLDKLDRRAKALKHDKNNALQDIFRYQNHAAYRQLFKPAALVSHNNSYNLANSILMLDEYSARKFARQSGFNFDNVTDRRRFFSSTFSLFIVLVDTRYSRATIYTNGIDQSASFSFSEMKSAANSDKMSIKDIMEYLGKNQMPKF